MPEAHTCENKPFGEGASPELQWTDGPEGTLSYAIVFKDLTLVETSPNLAYHWMIWNIPASIHTLPEALSGDRFPAEMEGAEQSRGSGNDYSYFGPCPSWQHACDANVARANDTYSFTLYAMGEMQVSPGTSIIQAEQYFEANALAKTEITVTSDAAPSSAPFCGF